MTYFQQIVADDVTRHSERQMGLDDPDFLEWLAALERRMDAGRGVLDRAPPDRRAAALEVAHGVGKKLVVRVRRYCNGQAVSNAWLKAYEMYERERLLVGIDPTRETIFFNAELPGSFVAAANHWLRDASMRNLVRSSVMPMWHASSLHPSVDPQALGDIYGLWAGNPRHWIMTPRLAAGGELEITGDLRELAQCDRMTRRVGPGSVTLYVSDAGVAYDEASGERQESASARVHAGQALCAVQMLRSGGRALMKFFTFARPWTFSLLAFLADECFDESCIVKPPSSRVTNSEVYFVGRGFRKTQALRSEGLRALRWRLAQPADDPFDDSTPLSGNAGEFTVRNLLAAADEIHARRQSEALRSLLERGRLPRPRHAPPPGIDPHFLPESQWLPQKRDCRNFRGSPVTRRPRKIARSDTGENSAGRP